MPRKTVEVPVKPEVLRWARESSGSRIEDAANKIDISPSLYLRFEREESKINLSKLRALAEYFKRPVAAFLLTAPPEEPAPPKDFRILPGKNHHFERRTRLAIRKASRMRSLAGDIMQRLGHDSAPLLQSAHVSGDPTAIAKRERETLGVDIETQCKWQDERQAYRAWRAALEAKNILVFQLPFEDARGFSLSDAEPFAIAVSSSDAMRARIFTLFHEYAHLLLRRPGVCLPGKESRSKSHEALIEKWCDQFAGELLVPRENLLTSLGPHLPEHFENEIEDSLSTTSRLFKVSEQVALWRMWDLKIISNSIFRREMSRLQKIAKTRKRAGGGRFSAPGKVIGTNGRLFTSLVLEARGRNLANYSDVVDYLSLNLKYLPAVQSSLESVAA